MTPQRRASLHVGPAKNWELTNQLDLPIRRCFCSANQPTPSFYPLHLFWDRWDGMLRVFSPRRVIRLSHLILPSQDPFGQPAACAAQQQSTVDCPNHGSNTRKSACRNNKNHFLQGVCHFHSPWWFASSLVLNEWRWEHMVQWGGKQFCRNLPMQCLSTYILCSESQCCQKCMKQEETLWLVILDVASLLANWHGWWLPTSWANMAIAKRQPRTVWWEKIKAWSLLKRKSKLTRREDMHLQRWMMMPKLLWIHVCDFWKTCSLHLSTWTEWPRTNWQTFVHSASLVLLVHHQSWLQQDPVTTFKHQ